MYTIRLPNGEFLDTPPNFQLSFELNNQVFSTSRSDLLEGAFTFPADLPLTDATREILNNPQLISNAYRFKRIEGVQVYCHGILMFEGALSITDVSRRRARISIIYNPAAAIKDKGLNEFDLGGERGLGGYDPNFAIWAATAERPEEYDYAVFPVYAPEFDDQTADIVDNDYVNWWLEDIYQFSDQSVALIIFPRVDYLLKQIFAQSVPNHAFVNAFQVSHELRRLYLLNNFDTRIVQGNALVTAYQIDLKNHVSDMKAADFLKGIMARFCLGLFSSPFKRTIILRPLRDVVAAPSHLDWSDYALADYNITDDVPDTPLKFCDPQPDDKTDFVDDEIDLPEYSNMQTFESDLASVPLPNGYYYILALEQVWGVTDAYGDPTAFFVGRKRRCVVFADKPEFEPGITPCMTYEFPAWGHFPWYEQKGSYWQNDAANPDTDTPVWVRYNNAFDPQIIFYRGFQDNAGAVIHERPYASNDVWRPDAAPLPTRAKINDKEAGPSGAYTTYAEAQYSLLWSGENGLYEKWWKAWHDMLRHGKHITMQFTLPVAALVAFSFEEKITVHGIDFLAKRLRIGKALKDKRVLVEASLVSCI